MCSGIMERKVPTLEQAYSSLLPLFFAALGGLARQGFSVAPADSMDLIHDFFAEAWTGLERHFDEQKGSFGSYAYGAFVRFARPRIVRLRRWQNSLMGLEELAAIPAPRLEDPGAVDQGRVRQALTRIPHREQEVLRRYVDCEYASERRLAGELGISRYRLREILVDALGQLAVSFDRPSGIPQHDWSVALALWRDRRTVDEAATVLHLTTQQVRSAYRRNFGFLAEALKHHQPQLWSPERREKMATQKASSALDLLRTALQSPRKKELLNKVQEHATEILEALDASGSPSPELNIEELPAEWVADVYQAIFKGAGADLQSEVALAEATEAHEAEDTAIGRAFRETLLADLGPELRYPAEIRSLPVISEGEQKRLGRAPDVRSGMPESGLWLKHGVRPLTVFFATKSISGLLRRYIRRGVLSGTPLVLGDETFLIATGDGKQVSLSKVLREEMARRAECSLEIAGALYPWLVQVAQYKSWLFAGFKSQPQVGGRTILLVPSEEEFESSFQRWGLTSYMAEAPPLVAEETMLRAEKTNSAALEAALTEAERADTQQREFQPGASDSAKVGG
jgi:RNA polymerase sigma factor (sigma-70 family)